VTAAPEKRFLIASRKHGNSMGYVRRFFLLGFLALESCPLGLAAADEDFRAIAAREAERGVQLAKEASPALAKDYLADVASVRELAEQTAYLEAAGEIEQMAAPQDGDEVMGIVRPIKNTVKGGQSRVVVFHAPAGAGVAAIQGRKFTYTVQMAHVAAGAAGAFYYVAYADTSGDGLPDKLIARSPRAQAAQDGAWTSWGFESDEHVVFVGAAWEGGATPMFYHAENEGDDGNWRGLGRHCVSARLFCAVPHYECGPVWMNLRVSVKH
jgi:hypothetical protein